LKEWHTVKFRERLPGLKFLRTLWTASVAGGPFQYTGEALRDAHAPLHITPEVFDEVILVELGRALDHFKVPKREKEEALAAFTAQKDDVTAGSRSTARA
jgi:hemoglobin